MGSALGGMSAHTRKGRPSALGDQRWWREGRETEEGREGGETNEEESEAGCTELS